MTVEASPTMQWSELATRYRGSPVAHFYRSAESGL